MPIAVLVLGFASIAVLVGTSHLGDQQIRQHELLERCVDSLEIELARSHLWLEEYLTGDEEVDPETDVWGPLETARETSNLLRSGGDFRGDLLTPPEDPTLLRLAENLTEHLADFHDLSIERFNAGAGVGSTHDQAYDRAFRSLLAEAQDYRTEVDQRLDRTRARTDFWRQAVVAIWSAIVLVVVAGLYSWERRYRAAVGAIQRSRQWLAAALSSIGDGVVTTDQAGHVIYLNPVAEDMVGRIRNAAAGRPLSEIVRWQGSEDDTWDPVASVLAGSRRIVLEKPRTLISAAGDRLFVDVSAAPILTEDGESWGAVLVLRDVSKRIADAAALQRREEALRESQKLEAVGRLAGGLAHDVSNYLGAIRGYCEVAVMKNESGAALEKRMGAAIATCHKVAALIRQLLAFSRRQPVQPEVVDLEQLVNDLDSLMGRLLGEDLTPEIGATPGPHRILVDPAQVEQALVNLLVNSRDAMPDGGRLEISLSSHELAAQDPLLPPDVEPGRFVCLSVEDDGPGIPEDLQNQIFEPFFSTKGGDHSGLGLATVYGVVRQNGGFLTLDSRLGEGSRFDLYFPATSLPLSSHNEAEASERAENRLRILLVEDNEAMRESTHDLLDALGHEVVTAEHARSAIEKFETREAFDLIVSDVVMPGLSGRDLADILRRYPSCPPFLFISGFTDRIPLGTEQADPEGPPVHFLQKPFGTAELTAKMREALGTGRESS